MSHVEISAIFFSHTHTDTQIFNTDFEHHCTLDVMDRNLCLATLQLKGFLFQFNDIYGIYGAFSDVFAQVGLE